MGLFNKKITLEDILKALPELSDDEKKALSDKIAETEAPAEAPTEEAPENTEETAEPAPEADENTEDNAEPTEETPEEGAPTEEAPTEEQPETPTEEPTEDGAEPYELETETVEEVDPELNPVEEDNLAETVKSLTDKVTALENTIASLNALKEEMEAYVAKQKDAFGYKGAPSASKKNYEDMSADELKAEILKG